MEPFAFKLYVSGNSLKTGRAIQNLRRACRRRLRSNFRIEVVDVLERPEEAEAEKILATPTLIKVLPLPVRRVVGDLQALESFFSDLESPFP